MGIVKFSSRSVAALVFEKIGEKKHYLSHILHVWNIYLFEGAD